MTIPNFKRILIIGSLADHRRSIAAALIRCTKDAKLAGCDVSKQAYPGPGFDWAVYDLLIVDVSDIAPAAKAWLGKIRKLISLPPTIIVNWSASVDDAGDFYRLGAIDYLAFNTPNVQRMQRALIHATQIIDVEGNNAGKTIISADKAKQSTEPPPKANKENQPEIPPTAKAPQESTTSQTSPLAASKPSDASQILARANKLLASTKAENKTKPDTTTAAEKLAEIPDIPDTPDALDDEYNDEASGGFEDLSSVSRSLPDDDEESSSLADPSFVTSGLMSILDREPSTNEPDRASPENEEESASLADPSFVTSGLRSILDRNPGAGTQDEEDNSSIPDPSFLTSGLLSILGEDKKEKKDNKPAIESDHSGHAEASFVTSGLMSILDSQDKSADGDQKVSSDSGFGYGWPFTPEEIEKGEAWLGDFQIFEFVSMGRSSSVFKAKQKGKTDTLALKLFNPNTADEACKSRFHRGYQLLASVNHPNIAKIYTPGEHKDWLYVVMEYFPKSDLKSRLRQTIKPERAIEYALQIAAGLQAAHEQHIIHRALKPSDILFREDSSLALADFGISKTMVAGDNELTKEGLTIGKPDYISPEQAKGQPLDARSDLYSLGIIMYEILEGRRPFIGATIQDTMRAHISAPMPPMAKGQGCVGNVVRKLLEKAPEDRYQDGASVINALKNCQ